MDDDFAGLPRCTVTWSLEVDCTLILVGDEDGEKSEDEDSSDDDEEVTPLDELDGERDILLRNDTRQKI